MLNHVRKPEEFKEFARTYKKPDIIMERPSITCPYCGRTRYMQGHYGSPASGFTSCGCEGEKRAVAESFEKSKREYEKESLERRKSGTWHPTTW